MLRASPLQVQQRNSHHGYDHPVKATGTSSLTDRDLGVSVTIGPEAWGSLDQAEWSRLAEASRNIFATAEWMKLWRKHVAQGESVSVACRRDGDVFAVWLLDVVKRGGVRLARLAGHGPGDELGPVCSSADVDDAARCLRSAVESGQIPADLVLLERLPGGERWRQHLVVQPIRIEPSPFLDMRGTTHDEWTARGTSKARGRRRRAREAFDEVGVIMSVERSDQLGQAMDQLLALHALRWADGESSAFTPPLDRLHAEFADAALERGWLRMFVAQIGSRPAAAWYGFSFGGATWFYQSGRDPQDDQLSAGTLVLLEAIDSAFKDGSTEFKLLRGGDEYKSRFSNADLGLETYLLPGSFKGSLLIAAASLTRRVPGLRGFALRRFGQA